ncbi:MAG: DUF2961 domain-containing protein [Phycisphaeraceae bacterium]|nr:DUF2961 domain-containing protein [Phycisphaeraceae bacterium]
MLDLPLHRYAAVQSRWASPENFKAGKGYAGQAGRGRKGKPAVPIKPGETLIIAESNGSPGCVHRIWATIENRRPVRLRGLRVDMYWDGCAKPAVSAPFGDFFGHTLGRMSTFASALFSSPEGRSFNCYVTMPFRTGMKITVTNELDVLQPRIFFDVDFTLGDDHPADTLYFHTSWRRENPTRLLRDFEILPKVQGKGRFLGCHLGVRADMNRYLDTWWGEGEVKVYLDGDDALPTLCGTGTEDYIGTGWGQEFYAHAYQGCTLADRGRMQYGFYRLHVPDPIYFHQDVRVTIQQIGWGPREKLQQIVDQGTVLYMGESPVDLAAEGSLFERADDWCACAYFYLDTPTSNLPPLAPASERTADLILPEEAGKRLDQ